MNEDGSLSVSNVIKEIKDLKDKFKTDDYEQPPSPYAFLEKATVLQEARVFHDPKVVREDPRQCCIVITKIIHLISNGQPLTSVEVTDVFFGVTKLFMSDDASLRRMVYLFIKEVAEACNPDDVIIVTSSLTKDMTSDADLYRANAIRVLTRIVDAPMLGAIERYVKQAIVDQHPLVASAALVSATHLFHKSPECANIVRRWVSETTKATESQFEMVQFHAMLLLYQIKMHDKLGVSKLVAQNSQRSSTKSPLSTVLLARYTSKLLQDEIASGNASSQIYRAGYQFLEASLRHKSELVVFEASRAICSLSGIDPSELTPAISSLQLLLASPKPAVRFGSIKILSAVSYVHPRVVSKCNEDLEALISDPNRSIATLAITTLLKTGSENAVDRLMKQISTFMAEISDEYKITVVNSIQQLCLQYPAKHRVLIGFLSNFLREEGGFEFKKSITDSIVFLMKAAPETTESSLFHLCEFIEDCEFTMLSTRILHLIGDVGPTTTAPGRYVRFIYNRVILENPAVRAAAVSALAKFAAKVPSLRSSIVTLLKKSLSDEDDETRDRAAVVLTIIENAAKENPYIPPDEDDEEPPEDTPVAGDSAAYLLLEPLPMSFDQLTLSVKSFVSAPQALSSSEPLTFSTLPIVEAATESIANAENINPNTNGFTATSTAGKNNSAKKVAETNDPASVVYAIPELAALGRVFRSSKPVALTESETEYVVSCIKHVYADHIVLQFLVQNTIDDQRLDNVSVCMEADNTEVFEVTGEIPAENIPYGETKNCFVLLQRNAGTVLCPSSFNCELHFTVVQVDPVSGEPEGDTFPEEYPLEDLGIATSDFMAKINVGDFRRSWEQIGNGNEVLEKFALQFKSVEEAVSAVIEFLGMQPCDGTETVKTSSSGKPHMLHLSGMFVGNMSVMVRAQIGKDPSNTGVILKIAVRSDDSDVSRMVADCIN